MPILRGKACDLYLKTFGQDFYDSFTDTDGLFHGGSYSGKPQEGFFHQPRHDIESVFWTLLSSILRVFPTGADLEKDTLGEFSAALEALDSHHIDSSLLDSRIGLLDWTEADFEAALHPKLALLAPMLYAMSGQIRPEYAHLSPSPRKEHLHEAMRRLLLQQIVDMGDDAIPLDPRSVRERTISFSIWWGRNGSIRLSVHSVCIWRLFLKPRLCSRAPPLLDNCRCLTKYLLDPGWPTAESSDYLPHRYAGPSRSVIHRMLPNHSRLEVSDGNVVALGPSSIEDLMEILEYPDAVDRVLESVDTLVTSICQATDETLVGVDIGAITSGTGVGDLRIEIDGAVGVSRIVDSLPSDETTEPLGCKKDVSKDVSNPSGSAKELTDGEARKIDDSYERLVSRAQGVGLGGGAGDNGAGEAGDEGIKSRSDCMRLVIVVIGGTVGVGVSVGVSDETELGALGTAIGMLETGLGALCTAIGTLETELEALGTATRTLKTKVGALGIGKDTLETGVGALGTVNGTLEIEDGGAKKVLETELGIGKDSLETELGMGKDTLETVVGRGTVAVGELTDGSSQYFTVPHTSAWNPNGLWNSMEFHGIQA